jgi:hypothetical protein
MEYAGHRNTSPHVNVESKTVEFIETGLEEWLKW